MVKLAYGEHARRRVRGAEGVELDGARADGRVGHGVAAGRLVLVGVVQVGRQSQAGAQVGAQEGTAHGHLQSTKNTMFSLFKGSLLKLYIQ